MFDYIYEYLLSVFQGGNIIIEVQRKLSFFIYRGNNLEFNT